MPVEIAMLFALGFLTAGLLALMIAPALWRRAVRLTRARIEAATPMTMSEFRADKDQLRAEFALATRRLQANVEALRTRLAGQLGEIDTRRAEAAQARVESDEQRAIAAELQSRDAELRQRIHELERIGAELAQRLRARERDLADLAAERRAEAESLPDIDALYAELEEARRRAAHFEARAQALEQGLQSADDDAIGAGTAVGALRRTLAGDEQNPATALDTLAEAENRIAGAENRLNALLNGNGGPTNGAAANGQLLADELSEDEELGRLRDRIAEVERGVGGGRMNGARSGLRDTLDDIASRVSRLVYAIDGEAATDASPSLFDTVRKFAGDNIEAESLGPATAGDPPARGSLASRVAALRDLQTTR